MTWCVLSYVLVWCWVRHRFLQFFLIISPAEEEREISGNNAYFQDPLDTQTTKVITRSVMYDSMRAQHRCAAHCTRSAHVALVVAQHERRLDDVCESPKLLVPEHGFKHGEDTLRSGRVGCEGEKTVCAAAELGVKAKTI